MVPAPSDAQRILTLTAAEASRITNIAITAFEPNPMIDGADRLDLAVIGLIPEELFSQAPRELPSSSHPDLKPKATGGLGVMIPAEVHRREALSELNGQLSAGALRKRWWSSLWLLTKVGQGPVEFDLPRASGDAFVNSTARRPAHS